MEICLPVQIKASLEKKEYWRFICVFKYQENKQLLSIPKFNTHTRHNLERSQDYSAVPALFKNSV